jgi:hypothetical protein
VPGQARRVWKPLSGIFFLVSIRKGGLFRPGKEIKGLRGGVHRHAAQASSKIDAAWAEKNLFRTETTYFHTARGIPCDRLIASMPDACNAHKARFRNRALSEIPSSIPVNF